MLFDLDERGAVFVQQYVRFRYEKWETVISHYRRHPRR